MNDQANSSDFSQTGLPSNLGMVLQRAGEELILEKVLDRFTVRPSTKFTSQQLSQVNWGIWQFSIPQANLEVFTVVTNQLDSAMSQRMFGKY